MSGQPVIIGLDYGDEQSVEVYFRMNLDGSISIIDTQWWKATIEAEPEPQKTAGRPNEGTGG
jgi:hypothetical protein